MARGGGGSAAADREAFFAGLPQGVFSPKEESLRQSLLDFLGSRRGCTFPLIEWIDRRLGGEIATLRDENGQGEIRLLPEPEARGEAFFEALAPDAFSVEEEALRESVFDFLASWTSTALAHSGDLAADPAVKERVAAFLPADVRLEEWIERRIGGEIKLGPDDKTGEQIIHLTPAGRPIVAAKFEALQRRLEGARPTKAGAKGGAVASKAGAGGRSSGPAPRERIPEPKKPPFVEKDRWFESLPSDQLTVEEAALREALLDFLRDWPKRRPGGRLAPILFQDASQDAEVQRCRAALPPTVPLREWIPRRIGGEVELHKDEGGQTTILLRGAAEAAPAKAAPAKASPAKAAPVVGAASRVIEDFFASLPSEELTEAEVNLHEAVMDMIEAKAADNASPLLAEVVKDKAVVLARGALMPEEVPLRQWLERRVGGEFELFKDQIGLSCIRLRGDAAAPAVDKDSFFAGLPKDRFTPEEESLREALLAFVDAWTSREPPSLTNAGGDAEVRRCRLTALPKGVSMREWIDRRMGGELETAERGSTGQIVFGIRGSLDKAALAADRALAPSRKRSREAAEPVRSSKAAPSSRKGGGKVSGKGDQWRKRPREEDRGRAAPRAGPSGRFFSR